MPRHSTFANLTAVDFHRQLTRRKKSSGGLAKVANLDEIIRQLGDEIGNVSLSSCEVQIWRGVVGAKLL